MVNGVIVGRNTFTRHNLKFALIFANPLSHCPCLYFTLSSPMAIPLGKELLKLSSKFRQEISVITVKFIDRCET